MVAAPPEGGETPLLVTVTGNTVAVQLSKMTLREPNMLTTFRHNQILMNAIIRCGLINVVNDGKPPSRATVSGMHPSASCRTRGFKGELWPASRTQINGKTLNQSLSQRATADLSQNC